MPYIEMGKLEIILTVCRPGISLEGRMMTEGFISRLDDVYGRWEGKYSSDFFVSFVISLQIFCNPVLKPCTSRTVMLARDLLRLSL